MLSDTRVLSHDKYLTLAFAHRFCLIAPGDTPSTHKVAETMAIGGAGGCVPVFVVPAGRQDHWLGRHARPSARLFEAGVASFLPYTSWLDYCDVGFLISEWQARRDIVMALDKLRAVSDEDLASKTRSLAAVREAFVSRRGSSLHDPTASEFILAEACHLASALTHELKVSTGSGNGTSSSRPRREPHWRVAGAGRLQRCRLD